MVKAYYYQKSHSINVILYTFFPDKSCCRKKVISRFLIIMQLLQIKRLSLWVIGRLDGKTIKTFSDVECAFNNKLCSLTVTVNTN